MKLIMENWRKYLNENEQRSYAVIDDDGQALYFEDEFKKEMHHTSPFIKEIARTLKNTGFTYVRRLLRRPDGGTDSSDQPVFLYHGNKQYIETMKEIALKYGIIINETPI